MNPYLQTLLQSNPFTGVATGLSQLGKAGEVLEKTPFTQAYRHARKQGEEAMAQGNPYLGGFAQGYGHGWQAPMNRDYLTAEQAPGGAAVEMLEPVQWTVGALSGGLGKAGQMAVPGARALAGSVGRMALKPIRQKLIDREIAQNSPQFLRALRGEMVGGAAEGMADVGAAVSTQRPRWLPKRSAYEVLPYDPERGMYPVLSKTEDDLKGLYYNLHGHEADADRLRGFATPQYEQTAPGVQQWKHDVAAVHEGALPQGSMTHEAAGHIPEFRYRGLADKATTQQARQQIGPGMGKDIPQLPEIFEQAGASLPKHYQSMNPYEQGMEYLARYRAGQFPGIGKIPYIENSQWYNPYFQYGEELMQPMQKALVNKAADRYTKKLAREAGSGIAASQGDDASKMW